MKKFLIITLALLVTVVLLSSPFQATAQDPDDPESIYRAAYQAFNEGDVDSGMALIADDVVGVFVPAPPGEDTAQPGKEKFRQVMEGLVAVNARWELDNFHIKGETASYTVSLEADDDFANLGVYPLEFTGFVIVHDGLIKAEVWNLNEDSRIKIDEAMAQASNEEAVRRYMEELWNEGDLSVADEVLSEDFVSHNFPAGDRETLKQAVAGFREENPGAYFPIEQLVMSDGQAIIINRMWVVPEGAPEGDMGEPVGEQMVLELGVKEGKITDRQLFMTPEE